MNWYTKQPKKTKNFVALTKAYNDKYGSYDYACDSRAIDTKFEKTLVKAVGNLAGKRVLVCGSNDGYEVRILSRCYPTAVFVALDVSTAALKKLASASPNILCIHANMESLPFIDNYFDVYINCRAIQSSNVNIKGALAEAARVTREKIVISIPNGYLIAGEVVNGMYDYARKVIDLNKPIRILAQVQKVLLHKFKIRRLHSTGELFLVAS